MNLASALGWCVSAFVLAATAGLLASWLDRKITARLQWRVGPPWYQNFADLAKLAGKEVLVPEQSNRLTFLAAPVLSVTGMTACAGMLLLAAGRRLGFEGDIVLFVYLLALPPLAVALGGSSSANILASLGVSREVKLLLSYELPFLCAVIAACVKAGPTTSLARILLFQEMSRPLLFSLSGLLGFLICVVVLTAKLGYVPFDVAEAEGEIASGALIEYSGILLGLFKLGKAMLLAVGPAFIVVLFWGGFGSTLGGAIAGFLKCLVVVVLVVLIKNTNPRLRIDQALRLFWGIATVAGLASILLACAGW